MRLRREVASGAGGATGSRTWTDRGGVPMAAEPSPQGFSETKSSRSRLLRPAGPGFFRAAVSGRARRSKAPTTKRKHSAKVG